MILLFAVGATAGTTNILSDAEVQGRALAQKILEQQPTENFTNTGALKIRNKKDKPRDGTVNFETKVRPTGWQTTHIACFIGESEQTWTNSCKILRVEHADWLPNHYEVTDWSDRGIKSNGVPVSIVVVDENKKLVSQSDVISSSTMVLSGDEIFSPFAGSDFWAADLGLEFFHWPAQKVLKKEVHRSCGCTVLESTNPNPSTNSYSRVVSWIDSETLGIVEAYAYDARGKLLKDFYPKDIKKVKGQWQVETLVMENVQTKSRSRLEFDLKK
jgi:hypothetical protein